MSLGPQAVKPPHHEPSIPVWFGVVGVAVALALGFAVGGWTSAEDQRQAQLEARYRPETAISPAVVACAGPDDKPGDPTWVVATVRRPEKLFRRHSFSGIAFNRSTEEIRWLFVGDYDPAQPCGKEGTDASPTR